LVVFILLANWLSYSQTIPQDRTVDWSQAGLLQTISDPSIFISVGEYGATGNGTTNDSPAIQSAIDNMNGNPGVLFFPAGTYLLLQPIIAHTGLVIKGEGAEETHLKFFLQNDSQHAFVITAPQTNNYYPILSGYDKGSQSIFLNSGSSLQIGDFVEIQEENGTWDTNPASWASHSVGQILQVNHVSENQVFFNTQIRITYEANLNPQIRKIEPIRNVKIENLSIERIDEPENGGGKNFYFSYAINCQVSGIESSKSQGSHIYISSSSNIFLFGNYIHDAFLYDGTDTRGYGITLNKHSGEILVENNIFKNLRHAMVVKTGANGNVFSYNYSREPYRSEPLHDYSGDISVHGHFAYANLFEENICQNIIIDHYWGPGGPFNTFFRNRTELYGFIMTSSNQEETANQNITGNEISNSFPYGFYSLTGSNHFEYANNDGGTAIPQGETSFDDESYHYFGRPWFLESSYPFPAIGFPNLLNEWSNPAKDRYISGGSMTVEIGLNVGLNERIRNQVEPSFNIISNPVISFIHLSCKNSSSFRYTLYDIRGKAIEGGQSSPSNNESIIPANQLNTGIYFIEISTTSYRQVLKFYKK